MAIELSDNVAATNTAVCCDLTDEVVILDLSSGVYFGLQGVGAAIWHHIQQPGTVEELVNRLMSEYDISREECVAKTFGFLNDLARHHLIAINSYAAA